MKSNSLKIPIILLIITLFVFSCEKFEPGPSVVADQSITQAEGSWSAYHTVYLEGDKIIDVSEYFDGFKININKNQSCCDFNGCESWTTSSEWQNIDDYFSNNFINNESGEIMFLGIQIQGYEKVLTADVKIEEPGFSFLPEGKNTGTFIIELMFAGDIEDSQIDEPLQKGTSNDMNY